MYLTASGAATSLLALQQLPAAVVSADAQIFEEDAVAGARWESSPQASELSTEKMNPYAPRCTKRDVFENIMDISLRKIADVMSQDLGAQ